MTSIIPKALADRLGLNARAAAPCDVTYHFHANDSVDPARVRELLERHGAAVRRALVPKSPRSA